MNNFDRTILFIVLGILLGFALFPDNPKGVSIPESQPEVNISPLFRNKDPREGNTSLNNSGMLCSKHNWVPSAYYSAYNGKHDQIVQLEECEYCGILKRNRNVQSIPNQKFEGVERINNKCEGIITNITIRPK